MRYRSIPISKTLVLALKKYHLASYNSEEGLVFCNKSDLPFQYNYVWYTHKVLCKKANIRSKREAANTMENIYKNMLL